MSEQDGGEGHHETADDIRSDIEEIVGMERESSSPFHFTKGEMQQLAGYIMDRQGEGDG